MQNLIHRRTDTGQWMQGCEHTTNLLNTTHRNQIINETVERLTELYNDFDTIACCGTSGLLVVPRVCEILKKNKDTPHFHTKVLFPKTTLLLMI
jgi:hypothetical protein